MLLAVCGFIGSGKDTVSEYLAQQHGFQKQSFADPLKDSAAAMFGWDRKLLEGDTPESREWRETVDEWWSRRLAMPTLTPRWVLQYWGTEVARRGFHDDIWTASLEKRIIDSNTDTVISDCRFPNEIAMVKKLGGKIVRVRRGDDPDWYETAISACRGDRSAEQTIKHQGIHCSEWSWLDTEFDHTIVNEGTLAELYAKVDQLVIRD